MYLSRSCADVGMVLVKCIGSRRRIHNHGGKLRVIFSPLAAGQPTQIFEGPSRQSENDFKFEEKLPMLRKRKFTRSRFAPPSNERNE